MPHTKVDSMSREASPHDDGFSLVRIQTVAKQCVVKKQRKVKVVTTVCTSSASGSED